jgi:hypothetical protein
MVVSCGNSASTVTVLCGIDLITITGRLEVARPAPYPLVSSLRLAARVMR